jgi:uncharacterized membrane protein
MSDIYTKSGYKTFSRTGSKTGAMVRMAVLVAIIIILSVTPLGFLAVGPISATIIQIPVIIGAIMLGPRKGALLGLVFGLCSFLKALITGQDIVATAIIAQNPLTYFAIAMIPRVLMGWLSGLLFLGIKQVDKSKLAAYGVTGFVGSMLNTVFYLGALYLVAKGILASVYSPDISAVGGVVLGVAGSAGIPEAIVSCVIVLAVSKALEALDRRAA